MHDGVVIIRLVTSEINHLVQDLTNQNDCIVLKKALIAFAKIK